MKKLCIILVILLAICTPATAQKFQVGLRLGINAVDFSLPKTTFNDCHIVGRDTKIGFETALLSRLNITRHLHLQIEFEYCRSGYQVQYVTPMSKRGIKLHTNRIELPLMLGVNIGPVRLFGGTFIRLSHNEKSSSPNLVRIRFNDSDVGYMAGVGFRIRKFFIETRISGYPRRIIKGRVESQGESQRVRIGRHIRYSLSTGILF
jgi:hypothetical protein